MSSTIRASLTAALAAVISGCAVHAPVPAPDAGIAVPAAWSQPAQAGAPLARWWRGFGDPLLVQLVDDAQKANTDLGIARANLRQARALREQAAAGLWPSLGVSVSAQRSRAAGAAASGNLFDAGFDASWEPDIFGATAHGVGANEAQAQASAATLASTEVSIAAEVAVSYLQLRGTQARAAFARQNLAAQEQTLQIAQWREQAGLGSSLETSQARSAVEQTRAQLPVLDASAVQTQHALAVLSGRPPAALDTRLAAVTPLPQPPAGPGPGNSGDGPAAAAGCPGGGVAVARRG